MPFMSDGLATAVVALLAVLSLTAAAVYFWINRPQYTAHDDRPRVQPLFAGDAPSGAGGPGDPTLDSRERPDAAASWLRAAEIEATPGRMSITPLRRADRRIAEHEALERAMDEEPAASESGGPTIFSFDTGTPRTPAPSANLDAGTVPEASVIPFPARSGPLARSPAAVPHTPTKSSSAVRFAIPTDGTLQFLPGRLESLSVGGGRDVRFVRVPGESATEVTFGRSDGPLYRHVQLDDATVSRMHARMRFNAGAWGIINLSATNPVVLNGALLDTGVDQPLRDGDIMEMGEIIFRFHER